VDDPPERSELQSFGSLRSTDTESVGAQGEIVVDQTRCETLGNDGLRTISQ
jgi:hypothetical protein